MTTNDQAAPVPIQSPADASGPGVDEYAGVIEELRRLRDEAKTAKQHCVGMGEPARYAYHEGRAVAYAKCLRLLAGEDKPEK